MRNYSAEYEYTIRPTIRTKYNTNRVFGTALMVISNLAWFVVTWPVGCYHYVTLVLVVFNAFVILGSCVSYRCKVYVVWALLFGGFDSACSYKFLRIVVCLSICRLSHLCTLLKPFNRFRCNLAGTLVSLTHCVSCLLYTSPSPRD